MRPYLAIIKDSFREAMASWVLYILLLVITVVLLGLAPIGYRQQLTAEFLPIDFQNAPELAQQLRREGGSTSKPSPAGRIWANWSEERRKKLVAFADRTERSGGGFNAGLNELTDGLNDAVRREDLYDAAAWKGIRLRTETRELVEQKSPPLAEQELQRRNRLLIEDAFPGAIRSRPKQSIVLTYGFLDATDPMPIGKQQVDSVVQQIALPALIGIVVGMVAILTAILVTSPIIPQMFEPGSISLLLSKPLSRSAMFLAKFCGGCAFIFLNVTYLLCGLWLIVGWQFGIWNHGLLMCIPVFLFLFAIYYSVSAFAGLMWKSPIVSVIVTVVFWMLCFGVGTFKGTVEAVFIDAQRINRVVLVGDEVIGANESGRAMQWNAAEKKWRDAMLVRGGRGPQLVIGPLYDAKNDRLIAAFGTRGGFGDMFGQRNRLYVAQRADGWNPAEGPILPAGAFELLQESDGSLLVAAEGGLFRMATGDSNSTAAGLVQWLMGSNGQFQSVAPVGLEFERPAAAFIDRPSGRVAIFSRGRVWLLDKKSNGKFAVHREYDLGGDPEKSAAIGLVGQRLCVAREDGSVLLLDTNSDAASGPTFPLEPRSQPRFIAADPQGKRLAVLFHNRRLWLIDEKSERPVLAPVAGQRDISAAGFSDDGQLLVVDRAWRVSRYHSGDGQLAERFGPSMSRLEMLYRYGVVPLYTVFPKPGELDQTVQYLITRQRTTDLGMGFGDLQAPRAAINPWRPVWSSAAFMLVMLAISCLYIERQEF